MSLKKKKRKLIIKKYSFELIQIIIGTFLMAFGVSQFLLPNQLSSGGVTGIATITYYFFNLPMGLTIFALNIPLFILSWIKKGKSFVIKGILGTGFLSLFIDLLDKYAVLTQDRLLACIYGGIIIGLGAAIIFKVDGSTGGSDLLTYILKSFNKQLRLSNVIVMIDIFIVTLNVIFFRQIEIGLYSAISIYIMGKIIDIFFEGIYFTKMMYIISEKYEEISKQINTKIDRGTTRDLCKRNVYK